MAAAIGLRAVLGNATGGGTDDGEDFYGTLAPVYFIGGLMSLVGAAAVLVVFCGGQHASRVWSSHTSQVILFITVCEAMFTFRYFLAAAAWFAGATDERDSFHIIPDKCWSASLWGQFFAVSSVIWNACWIAELVAILHSPLRNTRGYHRYYHMAAWGTATVTTAILVLRQAPKQSRDHDCWVLGDPEHQLLFEIPLYLTLLLAVLSLGYAVYQRTVGTTYSWRLRERLVRRHSVYVLAFVIMWAIPTVHARVDPTDKYLAFTVIDAVCLSTQTVVLSIVRLLEPGAMRILEAILRGALLRCCSCFYVRVLWIGSDWGLRQRLAKWGKEQKRVRASYRTVEKVRREGLRRGYGSDLADDHGGTEGSAPRNGSGWRRAGALYAEDGSGDLVGVAGGAGYHGTSQCPASSPFSGLLGGAAYEEAPLETLSIPDDWFDAVEVLQSDSEDPTSGKRCRAACDAWCWQAGCAALCCACGTTGGCCSRSGGAGSGNALQAPLLGHGTGESQLTNRSAGKLGGGGVGSDDGDEFEPPASLGMLRFAGDFAYWAGIGGAEAPLMMESEDTEQLCCCGGACGSWDEDEDGDGGQARMAAVATVNGSESSAGRLLRQRTRMGTAASASRGVSGAGFRLPSHASRKQLVASRARGRVRRAKRMVGAVSRWLPLQQLGSALVGVSGQGTREERSIAGKRGQQTQQQRGKYDGTHNGRKVDYSSVSEEDTDTDSSSGLLQLPVYNEGVPGRPGLGGQAAMRGRRFDSRTDTDCGSSVASSSQMDLPAVAGVRRTSRNSSRNSPRGGIRSAQAQRRRSRTASHAMPLPLALTESSKAEMQAWMMHGGGDDSGLGQQSGRDSDSGRGAQGTSGAPKTEAFWEGGAGKKQRSRVRQALRKRAPSAQHLDGGSGRRLRRALALESGADSEWDEDGSGFISSTSTSSASSSGMRQGAIRRRARSAGSVSDASRGSRTRMDGRTQDPGGQARPLPQLPGSKGARMGAGDDVAAAGYWEAAGAAGAAADTGAPVRVKADRPRHKRGVSLFPTPMEVYKARRLAASSGVSLPGAGPPAAADMPAALKGSETTADPGVSSVQPSAVQGATGAPMDRVLESLARKHQRRASRRAAVAADPEEQEAAQQRREDEEVKAAAIGDAMSGAVENKGYGWDLGASLRREMGLIIMAAVSNLVLESEHEWGVGPHAEARRLEIAAAAARAGLPASALPAMLRDATSSLSCEPYRESSGQVAGSVGGADASAAGADGGQGPIYGGAGALRPHEGGDKGGEEEGGQTPVSTGASSPAVLERGPSAQSSKSASSSSSSSSSSSRGQQAQQGIPLPSSPRRLLPQLASSPPPFPPRPKAGPEDAVPDDSLTAYGPDGQIADARRQRSSVERSVPQRGGYCRRAVRERLEAIAGHAVQRAWREASQGTSFPLTARCGVTTTAFASPGAGAGADHAGLGDGISTATAGLLSASVTVAGGVGPRGSEGGGDEGLSMMGPAPWEQRGHRGPGASADRGAAAGGSMRGRTSSFALDGSGFGGSGGGRQSSGSRTLQVVSHEDSAFARLRAACGLRGLDLAQELDPDLVATGQLQAHFSEAASASFFCRSRDGMLLLKTIEDSELQELLRLMPSYVRHLGEHPDSLIVRFLAAFTVQIPGSASVHAVLMANVHPAPALPRPSCRFDLKGSTAGRGGSLRAADRGAARAIVAATGERCRGTETKRVAGLGLLRDSAFRSAFPEGLATPDGYAGRLARQLQADAAMLRDHQLMDYSLLLQVGRTLPFHGSRRARERAAREHRREAYGDQQAQEEGQEQQQEQEQEQERQSQGDCTLPPVDVHSLLSLGRDAAQVWRAFQRGQLAMRGAVAGSGAVVDPSAWVLDPAAPRLLPVKEQKRIARLAVRREASGSLSASPGSGSAGGRGPRGGGGIVGRRGRGAGAAAVGPGGFHGGGSSQSLSSESVIAHARSNLYTCPVAAAVPPRMSLFSGLSLVPCCLPADGVTSGVPPILRTNEAAGSAGCGAPQTPGTEPRWSALAQVGLIDPLQRYDSSKQVERTVKMVVRVGRSNDISAVDPEPYARRFAGFVENHLLRDLGSSTRGDRS